jgi:hypothetical protein
MAGFLAFTLSVLLLLSLTVPGISAGLTTMQSMLAAHKLLKSEKPQGPISIFGHGGTNKSNSLKVIPSIFLAINSVRI